MAFVSAALLALALGAVVYGSAVGLPLPRAAAMAAAALFGLLLGYWTFLGVRAWATRQRVRVLWLRKFQSEAGGRFRVSRVVDRLNRIGIAPITLQDRDVALSHEQRRNRVAGAFVRILGPWTLLVVMLGLIGVVALLLLPEGRVDRDGLPTGAGVYTLLPLAAAVILGAILMFAAFPILLALAALGRIGNFLKRGRNDYPALPALLVKDVEKQRGAIILRIRDEDWRAAVRQCLAAVDATIVDVSELSEAILWEIQQALDARGAAGLTLIAAESARVDMASLEQALNAPIESSALIRYPDRHGANARQFTTTLTEAIWRAYENTGDLPLVRDIRAEREAAAQQRRARTRLIVGGALALVALSASIATPIFLTRMASLAESRALLAPMQGDWCDEQNRFVFRLEVRGGFVRWIDPEGQTPSNVLREDALGPARDGAATASNLSGPLSYRQLEGGHLYIDEGYGLSETFYRCHRQ